MVICRQPEYLSWAFNLPRGESCLQKWNLIPDDTDVLITHSPPLGYGDLCHTGIRAGCVELLSTIQQRVKPKYHIFGHIHEGETFWQEKHIFVLILKLHNKNHCRIWHNFRWGDNIYKCCNL